jgi:multimeric flavodoxin WrbA
MKITAINGSPKGKRSATYLMVEEFFKGAHESGAKTQHVLLADMKIHPCLGCFSCWHRTRGICVHSDDMQSIDLTGSDLVIYATPLYVDNISGLLKNFMDRSVFAASPFMEKDNRGEAIHFKKQKIRPKIMAIANCGYPGQNNFEVLKVLFRRIARNFQTDLIAEIYRDEGPLLTMNDPGLKSIVVGYKSLLQQAGREIAQNLKISNQTQEALDQELISHELYLQSHNEIFKKFGSK